MTARRYVTRLGVCMAGLVVLLVLSPGIGTESASYGWWDVWRVRLGIAIPVEELQARPFADVDGDGVVSPEDAAGFADAARYVGAARLARSLRALQVGMTLALCGATFQVLFRNPLATPYTLGVAGGGSLGALIAIRVGFTFAWLGVSSLAVSAFVGGIGVVAAVLFIARGARGLTSNELLLAGVTMGLFCSAMMMLITVVSDERATFRMVRWMMGSLDAVSPVQRVTMLPLLVPAWVVLIGSARGLNQYRVGDDVAATRGVNVARLQGGCVLVATVATAAVVATCGPIGFVGLVVPQIARLIVGADCRILLPTSALIGAAFLVVCDWGAQLAMPVAGWMLGRELGSATLPIGVVTAVVGVPTFLTLLRTRAG
ncbi:MAG: FecCD family ABC transporter permease [Phycisphaerae bacterium]